MKSSFSFCFPLEAVVWTAGLAALAFLNPYDDYATSLCLFHHLGFEYCPGCGVGHSISFLFHGDWKSSLAAHPLGIFAVMVLTNRIRRLMTNFLNGLSFSKLKS